VSSARFAHTLALAPALVVVVALSFSTTTRAAEPTAADLLKRYDAVMSPVAFEATVTMTAHRDDGSTRTYEMNVQKSGDDKLRSTFLKPTTARGQEMLRSGENMWLYMPNLKRAVRVASRDSFMGGDFNNADVLRPNYVADYDAVLGESGDPALHLLKLRAKNTSVAYDAIELLMSKKEQLPVRAKYYARSGKLLRSAEFSDVKDMGKGALRPTRIVMQNEIEAARKSEMQWLTLTLKDEIPSQRFVLDDLGR